MRRKSWSVLALAVLIAVTAYGQTQAPPNDVGVAVQPGTLVLPGNLCNIGVQQFTGTQSQMGRIFRDAIPSACPSKAYPGIFNPGTPYYYETAMYTNSTGATSCVTVNFDPNPNSNLATDCDTNAHASAYLNSYDPNNQSANYVGDVGSSITDSFSFDVPAAQDLIIVVTNTSAEEICDFSLSVVNIPCALAPGFTKSFAPAMIANGGVSTLTFTIDNTGGSSAATGLDFTDNLPAAVTVAATPNASTTCTGGTLTAVAASGTVSYTGGSVGAGASCTVSVDVTSSTAGAHVNVSGPLSSSLGSSAAATDTLTVGAPAPAMPFWALAILAALLLAVAALATKVGTATRRA